MKRKKNWFIGLALLSAIFTSSAMSKDYEANWDSLDKRPTPGWFQDAKFGIFIHWGVYSVPAYAKVGNYAEWYWNAITGGASGSDNENHKATWEFHKRTYGKDFLYSDFAQMFKCELYEPKHWAEVFRKSGAKYVVLTSKHHDGFCLFPNQEANRSWGRPWNSVDIGPQRDLLGTLGDAVRAEGLKMGFYYSLYEWYNPLWLTDRKVFVDKHMIPQFKDVVTRYKPSIIFADGEWDMPSEDWKSAELVAWLFNESPSRDELVINDRWGKETRHNHGGYYTTEYGAGMADAAHPWEESRGMGFSYGYNRNENLNDYKSAREMLLMLVDLVSRGGNLLLDIGPDGDGTIPVIMEERLLQIGQWLEMNGEAIYGTRPWKESRQWSEGEIPKVEYGGEYMVKYDVNEITGERQGEQAVVDAFFTAKEDVLYAILPRWPQTELQLDPISFTEQSRVSLLGYPGEIPYEKRGEQRIVLNLKNMKPSKPESQNIFTLKITHVK